MNKLKAFHGEVAVKEKYVARVKGHAKADEIIKGSYWEGGKGCAVGCTIEGGDHDRYETELGIPKELAYLEDVIFEELPNKEAMKFPLRFLNAIKVGSDLSLVVAKFVIWQFEDGKHGLKNIKEVADDKEVMGYCEEVIVLYKREIFGDKPTEKEFYDLYVKIDRAGAWAGARAGAGARAWAWAGAWAGARTWAGARAGAWTWAGARAWARAGAEYNRRVIAMADKLIELIKECK